MHRQLTQADLRFAFPAMVRKAKQVRDNLSLDLFMKRKRELPPGDDDLSDEVEETNSVHLKRPDFPEVVELSSSNESFKEADPAEFENTSKDDGDIMSIPFSVQPPSATPLRKTDAFSFMEPHISWDISPQVVDMSQTPSRKAKKSLSFSSSQERQSKLFFNLAPGGAETTPVPIRDPETDLLAKFTCRPTSASRGKKLMRTESASAILKTPTKVPGNSQQTQLTSPSQLKRSSTTVDNRKLHYRPITRDPANLTTSSLQEPITPAATHRRSLVRHATSPALITSQEGKMARLLSLANQISGQHKDSSPQPKLRKARASNMQRTKTLESTAGQLADTHTGEDTLIEYAHAGEDTLIEHAQMNEAITNLDISDFGSSDPASPERPIVQSKVLMPITPMSGKMNGYSVRANVDHLFTPHPKTEAKKDAITIGQDPASSDFDDSWDEDMINDLMEDFSSSPTTTKSPKSSPTKESKTSADVEDFFGSDFSSDLDDANLLEEVDKIYSSALSEQAPPTARSSKRAVSETTLVDLQQKHGQVYEQEKEEQEHKPIMNDFKSVPMQRTRTSTQEVVSLQTIINNPKVHRYLVTQIAKQQYVQSNDAGVSFLLDEIQLSVTNHADETMYIKLRENWIDSTPAPQHIIHVIGNYEDKSGMVVIIDNQKNLLVVQPDVLIPCTSVSEGFFCNRKIVLRDRLRSSGETNIHMIYGSIIHEIFQFCLAANIFTTEFIGSKIKILVDAFLEELFLCNVDPKTATEYLQSKAPKICEWGETFISPVPKPYSFVDEHRSRSRRLMSVSNIIDVEEEVWSPTYGLKGKIDVTVETCLQDAVREWKFLSPLEIKSSKNTRAIGHRAQTTLYTLLLSDRYNIDIKFGVLVYSETGETIRVPGFASEVRDLLVERNKLALAVGNRNELPSVIENDYLCRSCERLNACMVFHCVDNSASITSQQVETMDSPGILVDYLTHVGHVTPSQAEFFRHWNQLLTTEEQELRGHLKELWTMTSKAREAVGRCFARVKVQGLPEQKDISEVVSKYTYVMERQDPLEDGPFKAQDSHISPGDPIIVSDESGHVYLASGIFTSATRTTITITVNRRLSDSLQKQIGFDEESNQVFNSLLKSTWEPLNTQASNSPTFRIDKDEFAQALSVARNNLVELLLQKHPNNQLHLIVDLKPPRFRPQLSQTWTLPSEMRSKFNVDQMAAIQKCLSAEDYSLILGMPGTGKTTTIAALIEILVAQNKTVLLTSYTHSAVDTILRKIKDSGFDILRLGRPALVHPEVRHFAVGGGSSGSGDGRKPHSPVELEQMYLNPPVVAATCLGISHWLFGRRRKFDYCIVDEASQVTLPTCLGPIRYADRFILVGDHFQLSPLVKNPAAQEGGLDVSLFKRLSDHRPESVVNLEHQYRMCKDIMMVSNRLIYDGRLKCGSEAIASQYLHIPDKGAVAGWKTKDCRPETDWIQWVLQERRVFFYYYYYYFMLYANLSNIVF